MGLGGFEWILIALAFLMLFGAKRIPELVRGIGKGVVEFRKTSNHLKNEFESGKQEVAESVKYEQEENEKTNTDTDK